MDNLGEVCGKLVVCLMHSGKAFNFKYGTTNEKASLIVSALNEDTTVFSEKLGYTMKIKLIKEIENAFEVTLEDILVNMADNIKAIDKDIESRLDPKPVTRLNREQIIKNALGALEYAKPRMQDPTLSELYIVIEEIKKRSSILANIEYADSVADHSTLVLYAFDHFTFAILPNHGQYAVHEGRWPGKLEEYHFSRLEDLLWKADFWALLHRPILVE